jgi:DNA (cytosine-5)-methyltransferase 1
LDHGLAEAGVEVVEMCESWEPARRVLKDRFPQVTVHDDVAEYLPAHDYELLTAGFPCTDLSHAGGKKGIFGPQSGLVEHAFRIARETRPRWIVLENVPNLLLLHSGAGITHVVDQLEELGYQWAYRTVDSRSTGVPQRRFRVILLAALDEDPSSRLFGEPAESDEEDPTDQADRSATDASGRHAGSAGSQLPHGFYWTEGRNGIGLVEGAIPTLKGGSTLGTPCAPAVWVPNAARGRRFVLPTVEDAEELQGLPRGWTQAARVDGQRDMRWKLLGNAVTAGVGQWVGSSLLETPRTPRPAVWGRELARGTHWPHAAAGGPGRPAISAEVSDRPLNVPMRSLTDIIDVTTAPVLSYRATKGFVSRLDEKPNRKVNERWYADLEDHLSRSAPPVRREESWASSAASRTRMQNQRQKNTKPEMAMRRELTNLGMRYRLQRRPEPDLRSRMDIVFVGAKVAVDIRGCFWHGCTLHGTSPKQNADRWAAKLQANRDRDARNVEALEERGWIVRVVWEHDDPHEKAAEIAAIVEKRRSKGHGR